MLTKNPQNVHRKYFWAILITFICDVKIDINMCEPHYVYLFFLWTSSIVQVFDYLAIDIFLTINPLWGPAHPPKVKYSVSKLLLLLVLCIGLSGPAHPPKVKYSVSKLLLLLLAFQDQHTLPKWIETEYFTLGGCAGPERPIHRTSNNNSFETEYFTLWGCAGPERPIHRTSNNNSFSQNISLLVYTL